MKLKILCMFAAAGLLAGCAGSREHMGAAMDTDHNILTGGPVRGTTIQDLPQAVKDALQERAPHAEIAYIDKTTRNDETVYEITLNGSGWNGWNPKLYITASGNVLSGSTSEAQQP